MTRGARPRLTAAFLLAALGGLAGLPSTGAAQGTGPGPAKAPRAVAAPCASDPVRHAQAAPRIAAIALREHALFRGHEIDVAGRLWRYGAVEIEAAELAPALRIELGLRDRTTAQRVITYWETGIGIGRAPAFAMRNALAAIEFDRLAQRPGLAPSTLESLARVPTLLEQAAIAQKAWSAAFVSFVMREAALGPAFLYSEMHSAYLGEAMRTALDETEGAADGGHAYRACDPATTAMRVGDLLCLVADGSGPVRDFATLREAAGAGLPRERRGAARPVFGAHCDVVVAIDRARRAATLVGGNVYQSVARRELGLDDGGRLAARHRIAAVETPESEQRCREDRRCAEQNRRRYVALLQLR